MPKTMKAPVCHEFSKSLTIEEVLILELGLGQVLEVINDVFHRLKNSKVNPWIFLQIEK